MVDFYLVVLGFLAVLACFDLFVGVSNDAVNFLNSALGCRISSFRTTMWVASLGVLLGATFSSGMMEIARSGVFHPQMFTFSEIMVIFFAMMVADVLLLDAFNSLGLPTSTTVSIIFELLGSALAAALYKIYISSGSFAAVADYINTAKSLTIISGILISVVVAFVSGAVVQYIARLIFTFHFEKMYRRIGGIYGGFAITAIFYFLVMKGAKGASFMRPEWISWIDANTLAILLVLFVGLSLLFQALILLCNVAVAMRSRQAVNYLLQLKRRPEFAKNPALDNQLGVALVHSGNFNAAKQAFMDACRNSKNNPGMVYNMGAFLDRYTTSRANARGFYKFFLKLTGGKPEYAAARARVEARLRQLD